jgi:hypothetical protein
MAVQHGFGASVTNGLTFAYDTIDTVNSYLGEPTTNLFTNPAFTSGTSGWTFGSWDGGRYTYTVENIMGPFGEIVPALKVVRTTSDTSFAHFHQNNGGKFTNGNTYTISAWVKGSGTLGQYNQGGYGPITYSPSQFTTLTNDWQRVSYTLTSQTNCFYAYWAAEGITQNVRMYFTFAQAEQKPHKTQFVNGTRSATQGLLPLAGTSTIDLTSMSFDASAQLTFDGTNDYTNLLGSYLTNLDTSTLSIEMVFKTNVITGAAKILLGWHENEYPHGYICLGNFTGHWGNETISFYNEGPGTTALSFAYTNGHSFLSDMSYHHVVFILETNNYKIYIDGVEVAVNASFRNGSQSTVMPSNLFGYGTTPSVMLGAGSNPAGAFFNGQIPITKIYNRALSQAEVTQNFKKYQTRFGIA